MGAESLFRFIRACQIRLTGFIGDKSLLMNQFVNAGMISSVTGTGSFRTAVQDELDGEVDVVTDAPTSDFDTVLESRNSSVGPTGSTVVGNVLIEHFGKVGLAFDVVPAKVFGKVFLVEVGVGQGAFNLASLLMSIHKLNFINVGGR